MFQFNDDRKAILLTIIVPLSIITPVIFFILINLFIMNIQKLILGFIVLFVLWLIVSNFMKVVVHHAISLDEQRIRWRRYKPQHEVPIDQRKSFQTQVLNPYTPDTNNDLTDDDYNFENPTATMPHDYTYSNGYNPNIQRSTATRRLEKID